MRAMVLVLLDDGQKETDPLNFCSGRVGVGARAKVVVGAIACTSAAGAPVGEQVSKQARKQRSKYTLAHKRASKQTILLHVVGCARANNSYPESNHLLFASSIILYTSYLSQGICWDNVCPCVIQWRQVFQL